MTMNQCSACDSKLCLSACCGSKAAALSSISLPAKEMTFLHHGKHYMQGVKHSGVGAFFFSCQFPSLMCLAFHISNRPLCGYAADVSARICKNQHRLLCLLPPTAFGDFVIGCILWLYGSGSTLAAEPCGDISRLFLSSL